MADAKGSLMLRSILILGLNSIEKEEALHLAGLRSSLG